MTPPTAAPWLSPNVVTENNVPKELDMYVIMKNYISSHDVREGTLLFIGGFESLSVAS